MIDGCVPVFVPSEQGPTRTGSGLGESAPVGSDGSSPQWTKISNDSSSVSRHPRQTGRAGIPGRVKPGRFEAGSGGPDVVSLWHTDLSNVPSRSPRCHPIAEPGMPAAPNAGMLASNRSSLAMSAATRYWRRSPLRRRKSATRSPAATAASESARLSPAAITATIARTASTVSISTTAGWAIGPAPAVG